MKKVIVIFGSTGFLANSFMKLFRNQYTFITFSRQKDKSDFFLDFNDVESLNSFSMSPDIKIDGILFFQGNKPTKNLEALSYDDMVQMFNLNVFGPLIIIKKLIPNINEDALILFFSSIATKKGSYDPSYAAAKSSFKGIINSLAKAYPYIRYNSISLGLVEGSPVFEGMSADFRKKHSDRMYKNQFVGTENVCRMISELIKNNNINQTELAIDGGFN